MQFTYWNNINFAEAWERQQVLFDKLILKKKTAEETISLEEIIFCEHPHVYTLGRNGLANNLLIHPEFLKKIEATYYKIDRGGDITYHGPGQIVGYPILDLENHHLSLKDYIFLVEEVVIRTLLKWNIKAERLEGATGVWIEKDTSLARKICAIGVRASRYVTMHGFALNVNTDLSYYQYINPCGFIDKGVTSLQKECNQLIPMLEVLQELETQFRILLLA